MSKIVRTKQTGSAWGTSVETDGVDGGLVMRQFEISYADIHPQTFNVFELSIEGGTPTSGSFILMNDGTETDPIAYNASVADIQTNSDNASGDYDVTGTDLPSGTVVFTDKYPGAGQLELVSSMLDAGEVVIELPVPGHLAQTDTLYTLQMGEVFVNAWCHVTEDFNDSAPPGHMYLLGANEVTMQQLLKNNTQFQADEAKSSGTYWLIPFQSGENLPPVQIPATEPVPLVLGIDEWANDGTTGALIFYLLTCVPLS